LANSNQQLITLDPDVCDVDPDVPHDLLDNNNSRDPDVIDVVKDEREDDCKLDTLEDSGQIKKSLSLPETTSTTSNGQMIAESDHVGDTSVIRRLRHDQELKVGIGGICSRCGCSIHDGTSYLDDGMGGVMCYMGGCNPARRKDDDTPGISTHARRDSPSSNGNGKLTVVRFLQDVPGYVPDIKNDDVAAFHGCLLPGQLVCKIISCGACPAALTDMDHPPCGPECSYQANLIEAKA
jgi:hypothetical protein